MPKQSDRRRLHGAVNKSCSPDIGENLFGEMKRCRLEFSVVPALRFHRVDPAEVLARALLEWRRQIWVAIVKSLVPRVVPIVQVVQDSGPWSLHREISTLFKIGCTSHGWSRLHCM